MGTTVVMGWRAGKRTGSGLHPGLRPWGTPQRNLGANGMLSVYSGVSSLNPLRKQLCKERENIWFRQGTHWAQRSPSGCLQIACHFSVKGGTEYSAAPALRGLRASCGLHPFRGAGPVAAASWAHLVSFFFFFWLLMKYNWLLCYFKQFMSQRICKYSITSKATRNLEGEKKVWTVRWWFVLLRSDAPFFPGMCMRT